MISWIQLFKLILAQWQEDTNHCPWHRFPELAVAGFDALVICSKGLWKFQTPSLKGGAGVRGLISMWIMTFGKVILVPIFMWTCLLSLALTTIILQNIHELTIITTFHGIIFKNKTRILSQGCKSLITHGLHTLIATFFTWTVSSSSVWMNKALHLQALTHWKSNQVGWGGWEMCITALLPCHGSNHFVHQFQQGQGPWPCRFVLHRSCLCNNILSIQFLLTNTVLTIESIWC